MRVLHIISSGGMYGAEAVILNLSRALNAGAHASLLGVFSNSAQPNLQLHEAAAGQGIEAHLIPCQSQVDRTVPAAIRALAQQTQADVVHAHGYKADVYSFLALRRSPIPLVSTCHTWYDNDLAVRLYGALDRLVLQRFAGVVAVSKEVKQRLLQSGVQPGRIHLIRNGIDLQPFASATKPEPSGEPFTVGLVGRLAPEKGVDLFLRAAALVHAELPEAKFFIVGDGPDRSALQSLIESLSLQQAATLLGRCDDMPGFYASLNLLVSASRREGLPIALLEGMAAGLPLVATPVGAVPTVVTDTTGILVPPEDVPALAQGILTLLRDPQRRGQLGQAARQRIADEFSADRMAQDYLRLYGEVLAAAQAPQ